MTEALRRNWKYAGKCRSMRLHFTSRIVCIHRSCRQQIMSSIKHRWVWRKEISLTVFQRVAKLGPAWWPWLKPKSASNDAWQNLFAEVLKDQVRCQCCDVSCFCANIFAQCSHCKHTLRIRIYVCLHLELISMILQKHFFG